MPVFTAQSQGKKAGSPAPLMPLVGVMEIESLMPEGVHGAVEKTSENKSGSEEEAEEKTETQSEEKSFLKEPRSPNEVHDIVCLSLLLFTHNLTKILVVLQLWKWRENVSL